MVKSSPPDLALSAKVEEYDMKKQNWSSVLVALVAAFIGAGTGACVALWFKLPDHTVDVFAFVESALGIRLTGLALIVTLGVIRQSAAMETMPATKRDEMVAEVRSRLENETLQSFRNQYTQEFSSLRGRVDTLQSSLETVHGFLQQEDKRINQLEKQDGR